MLPDPRSDPRRPNDVSSLIVAPMRERYRSEKVSTSVPRRALRKPWPLCGARESPKGAQAAKLCPGALIPEWLKSLYVASGQVRLIRNSRRVVRM
jgi:hypothetical protein